MQWDWGILGKPSAIRKPGLGVEGEGLCEGIWVGGMIVLPRRDGDGEERDYEVLVTLEEEEMEKMIEGLWKESVLGRVVEG
jgi:hypothetical protein